MFLKETEWKEHEEKTQQNVRSRSHSRLVFLKLNLSVRVSEEEKSEFRGFALALHSHSDFVPRRRLELPRLAAYAPQAYLYTIPTPGHTFEQKFEQTLE